MSRLLVDSTVIIDALRGRAAGDRLRSARRQGDEPWVCAVSVDEIWRGILEHEQPVVRRLFRGLRCAPLGVAEGERAGSWRREFAARGINLHQADCLIAAAAVGIGATLATGNPKDFPMDGLVVDHWPVGR
jgi:predicted nucleic acid-binding protein